MDDNNIDYSLILSSYKVDVDRPSTSKIIDITKNMVINSELLQDLQLIIALMTI
ncbi:MAG: hypothetical protein ACJ703_07685 [Nitrososphaera sp.]